MASDDDTPELPSLPVVAIVGRPNVGKSTLFNRLAGRRISIEEPTIGVTRDRISAIVELEGRVFELIDTGGIGLPDEQFGEAMAAQIQVALEEAQVLVFVVDVREGLTPLDKTVSTNLRRLGTPVVLVANKADTQQLEQEAAEFFELGLGEPLVTCAKEGFGQSDVVEAILARLPASEAVAPSEQGPLKIAIVGKRNVGKSTLVNALVGEERVIASPIPGTTREAVDVRVSIDGRDYLLIDTAGFRKKGKLEDSIEFYAWDRAERSIHRADVVLLMLDVTADVSRVDKQLGRMILDRHKPCIVVGNKWDLAAGRMTTQAYTEYLGAHLVGFHFAPLVFISALDRQQLGAPLKVAQDLHRQAQARASTGELNRVVSRAFEAHRPRIVRNVVPKLYYATQVGVLPPTIVFFVNKTTLFGEAYRRYLENTLRENFEFQEIPIRLLFRERRSFFEKGGDKAHGR